MRKARPRNYRELTILLIKFKNKVELSDLLLLFTWDKTTAAENKTREWINMVDENGSLGWGSEGRGILRLNGNGIS